MKQKKERSIKLFKINRYLKLASIIVISIAIIVFIVLLVIGIRKHKYIENKVPFYTYTHKGVVNYSVDLLPNIIYSQKSLGENGVYVTDFVDNINTNFKYEYKGDSPAKIKGKYNVVAVVEGLLGNEKATKPAWKKEFILQPDTAFEGKEKSAAVEKQLNIKLSTYNDFIQQVTAASKINFETRLTIYWNLSVNVESEKGVVNEQLVSTMEIPPTSKYFEIKGNLQQMKNGKIEGVEKVISPSFYRRVNLYGALILVSTIALIFVIVFTYPEVAADPSQTKLRQILSKYGERIVNLGGNINLRSEKQILVQDMEDLIRVADDISKPVLYKKVLELSEKPTFYAIDENVVYVYELNNDQIEVKSSGKKDVGSIEIST